MFHKNITIKNLIENKGHKILFLPPYTPDFDPIENMFSKWKQYVRSRNPQNVNEMLSLIDDEYKYITSNDCAGYWRNMLKAMREYH